MSLGIPTKSTGDNLTAKINFDFRARSDGTWLSTSYYAFGAEIEGSYS